MIVFLIRKLWNNKWLIFCLLIGNILLVGIASSTPMYTSATMQRILRRDLHRQQQETNSHPMVIALSYNFNQVRPEMIITAYFHTRDNTLQEIKDGFGIPELRTVKANSGEWPALLYCPLSTGS